MRMQCDIADLKPGFQIGLFRVREVYPEGRGGMARVVRAAFVGGQKPEVALKISRVGPNRHYFFAALQKEVEILQKLKHPGVVRLHPVSRGKNPFKERALEIIGNPWFFGMECLHGGTLEAYVRQIGPLDVEEAAAICQLIGRTLLYIQKRGFAHNDVKPDNVVFRRPLVQGVPFQPVLVDFGVATKLVRQQPDGSIVYMAPERLAEIQEPSPPETVSLVDPSKADVWSMGILIYRLLVGREPFLGVTDRSVTSAIMRGMPVPIRKKRNDIPRQLDEFILEGCLAKDPNLRVSMVQLIGYIDRFSNGWRVKRSGGVRRGLSWSG